MAQKIDLETHPVRTVPSPGREDEERSGRELRVDARDLAVTLPRETGPAARVDRTVEIPGASLRDAAKTPPRRDKKAADAGPPSPPSPTSSERLAELAAQLPRVARDTYAVGGEVAKGGIGRVMRARDQRLDRPVALKELLVWNEAQEQRFVHEALLTARLQHPAIVPIYEAGRWPDGEPFYAMKLVSGRSLAELIAERKRLEERLSLLPHVLTVAQAIAYAHSQRILHRDLKPANVLAGEFGETIVIDWGLAKGLGEKDEPAGIERPAIAGEGLTVEGAVVGTPAYMPPEQAAGNPVDERADIYALGAMLYHVIAAVPPYHDTPWEKLLGAIAEGPPRPIEKHAPNLSEDLCAIVNKAMARDPARRYQAAKELADDLERFQTGQIVAAHSYSARQLLARFWRRNRAALSIALGAIAVLGVVAAYALVKTDADRRFALGKQKEAEEAEAKADALRKDAEKAGQQTNARADELTLLQAQAALDRDPNEALAWLKTLSRSFADAGELRRIAADAQARGISRAFRGHTSHVNWIHVFDGGKRFVTASDDRTLRLWDTGTGESRVLEGHTDEAWHLTVSADGTRIASTSKDSTARVWDASTGRALGMVKLPNIARDVVFRSDGAILGTPAWGSGSPWMWLPGTSEARPVVELKQEEITCSAISGDGLHMLIHRKDNTVSFSDVDGGHQRSLGKVARKARWELSEDGGVALWTPDDSSNATEVIVFHTDTGARRTIPMTSPLNWAHLSHKGDVLAAAGPAQIDFYDTAKGTLERRFPGHGSKIYWSTLSDDGRVLATGGYDRTVRTWNAATGETHAFAGLRGVVSALRFWPDGNGKSVLASSSAGDVRLFEPGRAGTILTDHHAKSQGLAVSKDGRVASVDEEGHFRITDLEGKAIAEHALGPLPGLRLRTSPDRSRFAGVTSPESKNGADSSYASLRSVAVLGTFDGARPTLVPLPARAWDVAYSPSGDALFVALGDGSVRKIEAAGLSPEIDRCVTPAGRVAVSPDGAWLAMGCDGGEVRLTELATSTHRELGRHGEAVLSLAFSKDGALLATGSIDHTIRLWRLADGSSRPIEASGSGVLRLAFSDDASTLFVHNAGDALLRRWSVDTALPLSPFTGHGGPVRGFAFSADGRRLLTYSEDRTARVIDAATGKSRALSGHEREINAAVFAPGDKLIVTLDGAGVVRAWPDDLPEGLPELRAWIDAATPDRIER